MSYFYKVVDAPELQYKAEDAKRFFMKDLCITQDVTISFIEEATNDPIHRLDYWLDKNVTGKHYKSEAGSGFKTDTQITGQMHGSRRVVYILKSQSFEEMIKTLAHEMKHIEQYDGGMLPISSTSAENEWAEKAAVNYESRAWRKYNEHLAKSKPTSWSEYEAYYKTTDEYKRAVDHLVRSFGKIPTGSY